MIKGAKFWNDRKTFYVQTNNPTESILSRILKKTYLETCGPTAAIMCLAALGYDLQIKTPGTYQPQPEEILTDWLNDPNTEKIRDSVRIIRDRPGNRIPQFYPAAVNMIFNVFNSFFCWSGNNYEFLTKQFEEGKAVQLQLKNPGHYIAAVAYDDETGEIIYNDPWPARKGLKSGGFNERLGQKELAENVANYCVVYPPL